MKSIYYDSPIGLIEICEKENYITSLRLVKEKTLPEESTGLLEKAVLQLKEYFERNRTDFDLPLQQEGTDFQQKAWQYLSTIPYGKTVSYKQMAEAIGCPKGCRAVGSANGKNNIAIIVPCHRVVNANNKLGGYAYGLDVKKKLLQLEQNEILFQ